MIIAILTTIAFGLTAIILSFKNDLFKKDSLKTKNNDENNLHKLSIIKDTQAQMASTTDPQRMVDIILASLSNFFEFSAASSMVIRNNQIIFNTFIKEAIGPAYLKKVEESMLSSFKTMVSNLPSKIGTKIYGQPINNAISSTYISSFHLPLVVDNQVIALIHLSSLKENAFGDMDELKELTDTASSYLTHLSQTVDSEIEKFVSLISSINYGIIMVDDKNNLLLVNDSAKKILDVSQETDFLDLSKAFGSDFNFEQKVRDTMLSKSPFSEKEIRFKDKILAIFVNPVGDNKVSVILHDITENKKKEQEKEDLINIMVHELRAPATTIKDSAELIITAEDSLDKEKKMKFLEIIHTQAKKVLGEVGSILDSAKLDAGKLVLQKTKGDIAKLIKDEVQTFMPQAERRNISLSFNMAENIPQISFDEIRISQVIDNLLSNSLKFTPEKGNIKVELDYKAIPPSVDGSPSMKNFLSLDKFVVISVSDSGMGITPEQQKFLFARYTQAKDTPEKISTKGTGLGLYLAKGIVEAHNGRIWVKSAPGEGTTFYFALPATEDTKTSYEPLKQTTAPFSSLGQTIN